MASLAASTFAFGLRGRWSGAFPQTLSDLWRLSTLSVASPAAPVLEDKGAVIIAVAKFGKGTVFAIGDPWLYNEYVDERKLPAEFDNYKAATDLSLWLLKESRAKSK